TEALVEAALGVDVERGRLLAVEGTEALVARARSLERNVLLDERVEIGALPNLGNLVLGDHGREPSDRRHEPRRKALGNVRHAPTPNSMKRVGVCPPRRSVKGGAPDGCANAEADR